MKPALKILNHPILIFFILGTITYIAYSKVSDYVEAKNKKIYVSNAQADLLREDYNAVWSRYPTEKEMQNQIDGHVMDEIFYKEAVAMGLDKSNIAVKKRLRQLMEMMLDDFTTVYATEQQLRKYLSANSDKFRNESLLSFSQLYFKMEEKDIAIKILEELKNGAAIEKFREYSLMMIPQDFTNETQSKIARQTGKEFANELENLEVQKWQGPVPSVYGWHVVWVEKIELGEVPDLNDVWDIVEREWAAEQKEKRKAEQYQLMREQYQVEIEDSQLNVQDNS